jgi:hypothetical protein
MATKFSNGDTGLVIRTELNKLIPNSTPPIFDPNDIVIEEKETFFVGFSQSGDLTISDPTNNYGVGASFMVLITTDGNDISVPNSWGKITNDYNNDSANYLLIAVYSGSFWTYSILLQEIVVIPTPIISFGIVATDASYIDVGFNTNIYGDASGSDPIDLDDLSISFNQNGGTATDWTATSIIKTTGEALSGGETVVRITGTVSGTVNGAETVEISVASASSIYNSDGVAMPSSSSTGELQLIGVIFLGQYLFDGDTSDSSTNGYDGIVNGSVALASDRNLNSNEAYAFTSGISNNINYGAHFENTSGLTYGFWFKVDALTTH